MSQMHSATTAPQWDLIDRLHKAMRVGGFKTAPPLAAVLGVHRNTINNYLNGHTPPDRRTLIAWSLACHVPLEWLEKGEGAMPTPPTGGEHGDTEATRTELTALVEQKRGRTRGGRDTGRYLLAA